MTEQATIGASVRSEVGRLRSVLLHRPGMELHRITPSNKEELLFDELLWVEHAQLEHDAFAETLRAAGTEVLYLEQLLTDLLADTDLAARTVAEHVTETTCGPQAVGRVRDYLLSLPTRDLVDHLIGGVSLEEVGAGTGLVSQVIPANEMVLPPLPNAVFMRDSSAWLGDGVVLSPMNRLIRRRETQLLRLVYTTHPRFSDAPIWFGHEPREHYPATFEGGDVLVVGERGIAIGISERTSPSGVETVATRLFEAGVVDRILAVELPKVRAAMHLDTIVTQVDVDAFLTYPALTPTLRCFAMHPDGNGRLHVERREEFMPALAWAAGLDHARAIEPALGSTRAEQEQWNDANNTLALRPGEVITYERNVATNEVLADAGITVRTIPSYELPRGRGGPRCMSCPVRRDPVG